MSKKRSFVFIAFISISITLFAQQVVAADVSTGEGEVRPTPGELKAFLTSGKVRQTHTNGKVRRKRFHESGLVENLGSGNQGLWSVDESGLFCQEWDIQKCATFTRKGNIYTSYRDGKKLAKWEIVGK